MRILLTGASGAIGSALAPQLASGGHEVVAFARDPSRVHADGIAEVVRGDVVTGAGLDTALAGVDVAYYLIHSMEPSGADGGALLDRERHAAARFRDAARAAGVRRVVYLGGLVPRGRAASSQLAGRLAAEDLLLDAAPEAVALRASIVLSADSRSFRFLVHLAERVPVMLLPTWRDHVTQPIDGRDVTAYLLAAGTTGAVAGPLSLDIAGPQVVSYGELMERITDALLIDRPRVFLPVSMTPIASVVAAAIAGERLELIGPLMEGLDGDLLPRDDAAQQRFGVRLHRVDAAIERSLRDWERREPLRAR
jgi:uncharacterized protein YbjT (DUF2867 family)